eukprot:Clim_evm7s51 gene=Clim_evmTU7s51
MSDELAQLAADLDDLEDLTADTEQRGGDHDMDIDHDGVDSKYIRVFDTAELASLQRQMDAVEEGKADIPNGTEGSTVVTQLSQQTKSLRDFLEYTYENLKSIIRKQLPDLEVLVRDPVQYATVVHSLGYRSSKSVSQRTLESVLSTQQAMAVNLAVSARADWSFSRDEVARCESMVDDMLRADYLIQNMVGFLSKCVEGLCPNLVACVGTSLAAELLSQVDGGVEALATMPADNMQLLGSKSASGTLTRSGESPGSNVKLPPNAGFLFRSRVVQGVAPEHQRKALRILSSKASLAVRCDATGGSPDGTLGRKFLDDAQQKIRKATEDRKLNNTVKALPRPEDAPKKRRGGKKARKMKERMQLTNLQTAANRIAMAGEHDYDLEDDSNVPGTAGNIVSLARGMDRSGVNSRSHVSRTMQRRLAQDHIVSGLNSIARPHADSLHTALLNPGSQPQQTSGTQSVIYNAQGGIEVAASSARDDTQPKKKSRYF